MNVKKELATIQTNLNSPNIATTHTVNGKISDLKTVSASLVSGDADLVAANIKKDVVIFGVTGTFTADSNATAADIKNTKTAYVAGVKITGNNANLIDTTDAVDPAAVGDVMAGKVFFVNGVKYVGTKV